jgi:hypothetical protein
MIINYQVKINKMKRKDLNKIIAIIEKISYMQSVDAEMFYLTIGVLKDLIILIKKINNMKKANRTNRRISGSFNQLINYT